jgi:UDP-GlcNAc:undecaprenyl-phosphate/decaprenyl-phosphate GlcNAc-1-phosphate transferase
MKSLLYSSVIAFLVSSGLMPIVAKVSRRLGALSETGGRHVGTIPIGRLGGVGVVIGFLVSLFLQSRWNLKFRLALNEFQVEVFGIAIGFGIVAAVGFWDDVRRLTASVKFGFQTVAALVVYGCGVRISAVDLPLLEPIHLGWFSLPVTVLWVVGIMNAINLIDGLDGLAGGVLLFASTINLIVAVISNAVVTAVLMGSVTGAVAGFLLYNWHPAKIYLGDGGAYSLGFLIAVSGMLSPMQKVSTSVAIMVPVLAAGLPIIDTILVMLRRIATRRGIFSPDRGHLHHILLDSGISHRRVVIGLYFVCCIFCSLALTLVLHRNRNIGWFLVITSFAGIIFWGLGVKTQLRKALIRFRENVVKSSNGSE